MFNPKIFIQRCLLALVLATTALGAAADPINFHVRLDSTSLNGSGFLDLLFAGSNGAPLTATASNFVGDFGMGSYEIGDATIGASTVVLLNTAGQENIAGLEVNFGGFFEFDVAFSSSLIGDDSINGSSLIVSFLEMDGITPAGASDYGIAFIDLIPGQPIAVRVDANFATVSAVPEPSSMLMMMTGLGLVGLVARRRKALPNA